MKPSEFHFVSADGLRIACAFWPARSSAWGLVQIAHGMGEHMGRYDALIEDLTSAGLTVYANDHRGHGRTAAPAFGDFGSGGFELLVADMVRLSRIARDALPGLPLVLLGHSMGSFAAQRFAQDHSDVLAGLVLSGSGALDGLAGLAQAGRDVEEILNGAFQPARTPFDWLSRDEAVVDAFVADPLCFPALQPQALASFLAEAPRLADPKAVARIRRDLPVYAFSGSEDPVGQRSEGLNVLARRYGRAGLTDVTTRLYPGGRHEMLNEINRGEVRHHLLEWLDTRIGGSAGRRRSA